MKVWRQFDSKPPNTACNGQVREFARTFGILPQRRIWRLVVFPAKSSLAGNASRWAAVSPFRLIRDQDPLKQGLQHPENRFIFKCYGIIPRYGFSGIRPIYEQAGKNKSLTGINQTYRRIKDRRIKGISCRLHT